MKTELTEFLVITYNKKSKHYINSPRCFISAKTREEACKKYKEMFRETSNAVKQAQKNEWRAAKKSLNLPL